MIIMKKNVTNCKYAHANRDGGAVGEGGSAGRAVLGRGSWRREYFICEMWTMQEKDSC